MKRKYTLTVLAILLTTATLFATPVSENGQLHVQGLQLTNECGYPVQLRGASTHGIMWFSSCYTDAMMDFVANEMYSDFIRIAMYDFEGTNSYINNPDANTMFVKMIVNMATARGMYALIDWHILADGDPNTNKTYAATFFTEMANTYKDNNNVIYEICNEPNGAGVTWAVVKAYADYIIPIIRAIDPDAVIVCGTPNWSQLGYDVVNDPLTYPNVMYAFHFYAGTHNTGMLTSYINSIPIFCSEWGPSDSTGNGGDNYANATAFINIMNGTDLVNNPAGIKISWAEWSLADNTHSSSIFIPGTCSGGVYDLSKLSYAGNYVFDKINNPENLFICGTPTFTPTSTPYAGTPTFTYTITPTSTQLPWDLIYDGDTAGYTLADGAAVSNAWINANATPVGTITETTGGTPGNGMYLNFVTPGWWEGHSWSPSVPKTIGSNNYIEFEIKSVVGSVQQFRLILDRDTKYVGVNAGASWTTVRIPLSQLYTVMPSAISELDFICNYNTGYSLLIDNIRLLAVPTYTMTITKTITSTRTITPTHSVSPTATVTRTVTRTMTYTFTRTVTPTRTATSTVTRTPTRTATSTVTRTPTRTQTMEITPTWTPEDSPTVTPTVTQTVFVPQTNLKYVYITDVLTYPNPSTGEKITFRYNVTGLAEKLTINVYTFGERKIYSVVKSRVLQGIHTQEWVPPTRLANGLYYYTVEGTNGTRPVSRHLGAFVINGNLLAP